MVQADITAKELDLISYLIETTVDWLYENDTPGIIEDNIMLWGHSDLETLWAKLEAAQERMRAKLEAKGLGEDLFQEEIIEADFSVNARGIVDV